MSQRKPINPEAHERMLAGIVGRAATNGKGLGVAMPPGVVGGRFTLEPQPQEQTAEEQAEEAIALDAAVHKIATALAGANMDYAITALISMAVHYAMSAESTPELRIVTLQRLVIAVDAIGEEPPK